MKMYEVTITEVLKKEIKVLSRSPESALQMVMEGHKNGEYVLDSADRDDVKFKIEYSRLNPNRAAR